MKSQPHFSSSLTLFTVPFLIFFFTLLNGYGQNLVAGYRANTWLVLLGVIVAMVAVLVLARGRAAIEWDWLEAAGFVLVTVGVWAYFILPSLPTLLPPTQSSDAARAYTHVLFSYPEGKLVSWYPAGGAFVVAMLSHWLGILPLRLLHPVTASFAALSAGAVYGMTCALLPPRRLSKALALIAPALLFVPWSYFAGAINWEQYFFAQTFAQYFILAALWFIARYAEQPHWIWAALIGAALLAVVAAYPIFVALPPGLFGLVAIARIISTLRKSDSRHVLIVLGIFLGSLVLAGLALQQGGILEFKTVNISLGGEVGAGGVANPSLETLGGPVFLLLVLIGAWLAWRANIIGRIILGFGFVWVIQLIGLLVAQPLLQISGYRVDKTFYVLVYPLALFAALALAYGLNRVVARFESPRVAWGALIALVLVLGTGIMLFRPPKAFALFTESELQAALWAKEHLETYQVAYLDPNPTRAYWLAFGLWSETLPNEWFQWIPAGNKLGPKTFYEWMRDPAWQPYVLLRDASVATGAPVRTVYQNGASAIVQKDAPQTALPVPMYPSKLYFGTTLRLVGYDLARTAFAPGETISLTTYIESIYPPPATVGWRVEISNRGGKVVAQAKADPFNNQYPVQRWFPGKLARDEWALLLPANLLPGGYALQLGLYRRDNGEGINVHTLFSETMPQINYVAAPLAKIKIPLDPPSRSELDTATALNARLGDSVTLLKYALDADRTAQRVKLTVYWQGFGQSPEDYTAFVHLLDGSRKLVAQKDAQPRDGAYPTSIWDVGEIIKDEYELSIPADARGPFSIAVGMYSQPSLKRLPIGDKDQVIFDLGF